MVTKDNTKPKAVKKAKKKGLTFLGHDLKVTPIKKILRERAARAEGKKSQDTKDYLKKVRKERAERALKK